MSLLIPIEIATESNSNLDSDFSSAQTSSSSLDAKEIVLTSADTSKSEKISAHHSLSFDYNKSKSLKSPNKSISLCDSSKPNSNNSLAEESVADFLIRIDSSIAKTKNQVEKMSQKIDENCLEQELNKSERRFRPPKLASSDRNVLSASSSRSLFPFDNDGNLPRVSMSNNHKKVKSSLKRFEKSHEEIFEL